MVGCLHVATVSSALSIFELRDKHSASALDKVKTSGDDVYMILLNCGNFYFYFLKEKNKFNQTSS